MAKKLKIACLHGYGTNAKFLQRQMRSFTKAMGEQLQFVFIDAPYKAPQQFILDQKLLELIQGQPRSWTPFISYRQRNRTFTERVIKGLQPVFEEDEYDGLLGFSQGCAMIHFILEMSRMGLIKWKWVNRIKLCILVCGFTWSWQDLHEGIGKPLEVCSIHLVSEVDFSYQKSLFATTHYSSPVIIQHPFGHTFPRLGRLQFQIIKQIVKIKRAEDQKYGKMEVSVQTSRL